MKSRFFNLSILAAMTLAVVSSQAVSAQEQRGARFNFAPNVWKNEEPRIPQSRYMPAPVHAVKHGSMPQSSSFLLDPNMMPEQPKPVVAAAPVMQVTPQVFVPKTNYQMPAPKSNYQPAFGKPLSATPLAMAPMPVKPAAPAATATKHAPVHVARNVSARLRHPVTAHTGVTGKLLTRPHAIGQQAAPVAASYGKNFGYAPGGYLPAQSGSGTSTRQEVTGKLLH
ncbi:MAG: hypothetical protein K2W82_07150 [Candidatus Obscuribacterales bacterium]|nr:hypothetical protein [Candidatus Obscuribacterales bacterium]